MNIKRITAAIFGSLLILFCCTGFTAFAETSLPEGAVKGLPERLAALDDEGNAVNSATGEYFFHVEDMEYGETYTKKIQLINLREDASYHIYFYVEPLFKDGEIDLEEGCTCRFYLDGSEIYNGDVNGKGNIDLTTQHFDCGYYAPGDSHTLRCEIIWNDLDVLKNVDNGWRLVDKDGEHVLVGPDGEGHVEGEIEFKWVFYAQVDPDESSPESASESSPGGDNPGGGNTPDTGILASKTFWIVSVSAMAAMVFAMLFLIRHKNRNKYKQE